MKKLLKKLTYVIIVTFVTVSLFSCTLNSKTTLEFTKFPKTEYNVGEVTETQFLETVQVKLDGKPITLTTLKGLGATITGIHLDQVGSYTLVVIYEGVSITFEYDVVEVKPKPVEVATVAELEKAVAQGQNVALANNIELSKTLALKKDTIIDLNGYDISVSAGFPTYGVPVFQVYDKSNANVIITSSKDGAELNVAGYSLILNYGNVEFSNVEINVGDIRSSSYQTFKTYGNLTLGEGVIVNVEYLGTSVINATGACEILIDGAVFNVNNFVVNWGSFIYKANATVLTIDKADINIKSLGNATYPAYSYFISNNLLVTINECNFDAEYDGVKYTAVDEDGKYKWVEANSSVK